MKSIHAFSFFTLLFGFTQPNWKTRPTKPYKFHTKANWIYFFLYSRPMFVFNAFLLYDNFAGWTTAKCMLHIKEKQTVNILSEGFVRWHCSRNDCVRRARTKITEIFFEIYSCIVVWGGRLYTKMKLFLYRFEKKIWILKPYFYHILIFIIHCTDSTKTKYRKFL